jgi:phage major head subunit gpT-like protein
MIDRIDIFTQAMNAAFINGYDAIAEIPPIAKALQIVPSGGRIENYPWMYPPPLLHQWQGFRQYAKLGETNYRVENKTYTAEFEALYEDLQDDQVDGFKRQAAALAQGAKEWQYLQPQINLALGQNTLCFDGSNFFATSHNVGSGNNIVTGTAAGTDGQTHAMAVLITTNKLVKPLLWQNREGPDFQTDAGTPAAKQARLVKWWADMRGAAAFGFWWDAVLVKFANTPTVAEMQTTLGTVNARLRSFTYPKSLPSDINQYPHGQQQFSSDTVLIVCSTLIDHILRQALTLSLIGQTENFYKGFATQVTSGYLDDVV